MIPELIFEPDHKNLQSFWKIYKTENRFHSSEVKTKGKFVFWGNKNNRVCRYCKRNSTSTKFNSDAHIIPLMMGNKILLSFYECDECNNKFAKYENELKNFGGIWHSFSRVKGRRGVAKYQDSRNNLEVICE